MRGIASCIMVALLAAASCSDATGPEEPRVTGLLLEPLEADEPAGVQYTVVFCYEDGECADPRPGSLVFQGPEARLLPQSHSDPDRLVTGADVSAVGTAEGPGVVHVARGTLSDPGLPAPAFLEDEEILASSDPFVEGDTVALEWGDVPDTD